MVLRDIQMHAIVYSPDANGGPGAAKLELDPDMLNVTWQQALNFPGQCALTMTRFNPKLSSIDYMADHIKLFRERPGKLPKVVFAGKLIKPDASVRDSIIYGWDYVAFLQRSRTGFRTLYPEKLIGTEIVGPEWNLARTVASSPFAFVSTGTIENPLALDGVTPIKTNKQFGVVDFDRLYTFFALSELSMANTSNTVVFEITRDEPHTFNFWRNRSADRTNYAFMYPGNIIDYTLEDGHDQIVNDLATIIVDPATGAQTDYSLTDAASIATYRRLQSTVSIKTLYGLNSGSTETDQQKAALARLISQSATPPSLYTIFPRQGEIDPFDGWQLGDKMLLHLAKPDRSGDEVAAYKRVTGIAAAWTPEAGELIQLFMR
jgi:hypothetical protein